MAAPVKKFKSGVVEAAVWENQGTSNGQNFVTQSVSFNINYQDKEKQWKQRSSFKFAELFHLVILIQKLWSWKYLKTDEGITTTPNSNYSTSSDSDIYF